MWKKIAIVTPYDHKKSWWVETFTKTLQILLTWKWYHVDIIDENFIDQKFKIPFLNDLIINYKVCKFFNENSDKYDIAIFNWVIWFFSSFKQSIVIFHGSYYWIYKNVKYKTFTSKFWKIIYKFLEKNIGRNKKIVCVSENTKADLVNWYKLENELYVINNSIDTEKFSLQTNQYELRKKYHLEAWKYYILFLWIWWERKWNKIIKELIKDWIHKDIHFLIVSHNINGIEKNELTIHNNVTFIWDTKHSDIHEIYWISDLFLFPSKFEWCSYTLLESMSCWIPFVISDAGNATDIKQNHRLLWNYILGKESTTWEYKKLILELYNKKDLESLKKEIRNYAQNNFNHDIFIEKYEKIINTF